MTSTLNNSTNLVIENREDIRNANIKQEEIIDHHKFRNGTHSNAHVGMGYKPKWSMQIKQEHNQLTKQRC